MKTASTLFLFSTNVADLLIWKIEKYRYVFTCIIILISIAHTTTILHVVGISKGRSTVTLFGHAESLDMSVLV